MSPDPARPGPESFGRYLAKLLVSKQGYTEVAVPEAQLLATASDIVLTKSDGMTFSTVCIVDAEQDASRKFQLDRGAVVEIAKACKAKYCGTINGAKMPAQVEIIEARPSVS